VRADIGPNLGAFIAPTIGLSNFIFRVASGFIAYKVPMHTTMICGFGIAFGGVFVFTSAFYGADIIWFQFLYGACYGVSPGKTFP